MEAEGRQVWKLGDVLDIYWISYYSLSLIERTCKHPQIHKGSHTRTMSRYSHTKHSIFCWKFFFYSFRWFLVRHIKLIGCMLLILFTGLALFEFWRIQRKCAEWHSRYNKERENRFGKRPTSMGGGGRGGYIFERSCVFFLAVPKRQKTIFGEFLI